MGRSDARRGRRRGRSRVDLRHRRTGDRSVRRGRHPVERSHRILCSGRRHRRRCGFANGFEALQGHRGGATVDIARPRSRRRRGRRARRGLDRAGGGQGSSALAVDTQHMGRRLARQHGSLDPRHRTGVADAYGRAPQRRNPRRAVLPVDVPRRRRGVQPTDFSGAHLRLHAQLGRCGGLAVSGERGDPDLEAAAGQVQPMACGGRGRDRRGPFGVLHRDPVHRVRHRVDAQPRRIRHRRARDGVGDVGRRASGPHPARRARTARGVLRSHHRRRGDCAVRRGLVARRRAVASRSRQALRLHRPRPDRRADGLPASAAVRRRAAAGRDHRGPRIRHARG